MHMEAWEKSVSVELRWMGETRNVSTPREAVDCLLQWPYRDGKRYQKAMRHCLYALIGEKPTEKARSSFLKAAKEADIFVRQ